MSDALYVTNFASETSEDELRALFAVHGEVVAVTFGTIDSTGEPFAAIQMASQKVATKALNALNGHDVGGSRLAVSHTDVDVSRELTSKQRHAMEDILKTLEETEKVPVRQIDAMVRLCGLSFVEAIVAEALAIDAGEGMVTSEGTRRTRGGIVFYLARHRMSPACRKVVYNRKGKLPREEKV